MVGKNHNKEKKICTIISVALLVVISIISSVVYISNKPLTDRQIFSLFNGEFDVGEEIYYYGYGMSQTLNRPVPVGKIIVDKDVFSVGENIFGDPYSSDRYDVGYWTVSPVYYDIIKITQDNLEDYRVLTQGLIKNAEVPVTKKNVFILVAGIRDNNHVKGEHNLHSILYIDGDYYLSDTEQVFSIKKISDKVSIGLAKSSPQSPISPFIGEYELINLIDFVQQPNADSIDFIYGSVMRISSDVFVFEDTAARAPYSVFDENRDKYYVVNNPKYDVSPLTADSSLTSKDNRQENVYDFFSIDEPLDNNNSFIIKVTNDVQKEPVYIYIINGRYYVDIAFQIKAEYMRK